MHARTSVSKPNTCTTGPRSIEASSPSATGRPDSGLQFPGRSVPQTGDASRESDDHPLARHQQPVPVANRLPNRRHQQPLLKPESNFLVGAESDGILNLARYEIPTTVQSHYLQNELHGNFTTGSIKHKTIIGIELGRENSAATASGDFGGDTSTPGAFSFINIFNTNDRLFLNPALTKFSDSSTQNNILGAYFGDQVDLLDNLHVHFGGRFDLFDQTITNHPDDFTATRSQNNQTDTAFSPSVGIAYQPVKPITLFANYGIVRSAERRIAKHRRDPLQSGAR